MGLSALAGPVVATAGDATSCSLKFTGSRLNFGIVVARSRVLIDRLDGALGSARHIPDLTVKLNAKRPPSNCDYPDTDDP